MTPIPLAYIDPNSGGLIMQLLFPIFVAVGAAWVFCKQKITNALKQILRRFRRFA
jgi:hypothetical protein